VLIDVFFYFGDLFRVDVQLQIAKLGDRAVPALLEAKKHDVEKVRRWAAKQLDALGRAIPGEAVQIADPEVLADVLRAYGRAKEIDALRVVVSFTSSDRVHVREAAREALVSYGEAALWMLREAIESATGKRPPAGTPWDKLATDLFEGGWRRSSAPSRKASRSRRTASSTRWPPPSTACSRARPRSSVAER